MIQFVATAYNLAPEIVAAIPLIERLRLAMAALDKLTGTPLETSLPN